MRHNTKYIAQIEKLFDKLNELPIIQDKDRKELDKKFRLEFNYNSNHIEGNTLTYGQTKLLLLADKSIGDAKVSDIEEMKAHDLALRDIQGMAYEKERPLTEQFIKELNKTILVRDFWKEAITPDGSPTRMKIEVGKYKLAPNSVQLSDGEVHEYASVRDTPLLMGELVSWYQEKETVMHPIQLATEFHYKFVSIHPFGDGNGRVSRLLMNYVLYKNNYPPVIIKSEDKESYLTALQKADAGYLLAFMEYIEKQLIWSLELSLKATKGESIEEENDLDKEIAILKRNKLTKERIFKSPKVAYETFKHIENEVWSKLDKAMDKFSDFFVESDIENYVFNIKGDKENMPTADLYSGTTMQAFFVKLRSYDISNFSWTKKMHSLKSASKKTDFNLVCSLSLSDSEFKVEVKMNSSVVFEEARDYNSFFYEDEAKEIVKTVSKKMLETIKEYS
jgi:Fic family protein